MSITVNENLIYDLQAQLRTANETIARLRSDVTHWRDERREEVAQQAATIQQLRIACGLVIERHGCGGDSCTEQAYLEEAFELIATTTRQAATIEQLLEDRDEALAALSASRGNALYPQRAGHGYDAGCECDLEGGDRDCQIQPPFESTNAYCTRLRGRIITAEATISELREMIADFAETTASALRGGIPDPHISDALSHLCIGNGYGNVIATASMLWRQKNSIGGAFLYGPCEGVARPQLERALALLARLPKEKTT